MRDLRICFLFLPSILGLVGSQSSSLFEASKALSSTNWEKYKTASQPSEDMMQCLARCEHHHNSATHPGWKRNLNKNDNSLTFVKVQCCQVWRQRMRGGKGDTAWRHWGRSSWEKFPHPVWGCKVCLHCSSPFSALKYIEGPCRRPVREVTTAALGTTLAEK